MHVIFSVVKFYPILAIGSSMALLQLGLHFKRRSSNWQYFCLAAIIILLGGVVVWSIYRGDLNSDDWVRNFF